MKTVEVTITGRPGAGKSSVGNLLVKALADLGIPFQRHDDGYQPHDPKDCLSDTRVVIVEVQTRRAFMHLR